MGLGTATRFWAGKGEWAHFQNWWGSNTGWMVLGSANWQHWAARTQASPGCGRVASAAAPLGNKEQKAQLQGIWPINPCPWCRGEFGQWGSCSLKAIKNPEPEAPSPGTTETGEKGRWWPPSQQQHFAGRMENFRIIWY